jgi:hypothetical protein
VATEAIAGPIGNEELAMPAYLLLIFIPISSFLVLHSSFLTFSPSPLASARGTPLIE